MVREDYLHLAQVMQSVRFQVKEGKFPASEYERLVDRMIWAITASPDGSPSFNSTEHQAFIDRCNGRAV